VLQRNTSGYPIELPTLGLGRQIHPGEDFDHEERLAGFTPVEELDQADDTDAQPDTATEPSSDQDDTAASDTTPQLDAQPSPVPVAVDSIPVRDTTQQHAEEA
jgi:hypothetical protein